MIANTRTVKGIGFSVSYLGLSLLVLGTLAGCGSTSAADRVTTLPKQDTTGMQDAKKTPEELFAAEKARGDQYWSKRNELPELEKAIAAYQSAAKINPKDPAIWTRLSRAFYLKADGFLSFDKESSDDAMKTFLNTHEQGIVYAKRAMLAHSSEYQKKTEAGVKMEDAMQVLNKEAVPAMYWFASNYGKWGVAKGFTTILKYKDMIKKTMDRVVELDPDFFHAAGHRYMGAYYSKTPSFAGGDMNKSKQHFDKSLSKAPHYFGTKVLMAEYYAKKEDDRALFEKLLKEVIDGNPDASKDIGPENRIEQKKAKALMKKIDEIF
jgi:tetratricopeptide (TPR) repeat protein